MAFGTHVFISYAHHDNDEIAGAWVTRFHELLEAYLKLSLKRTKPVIWRDKRLADNEVFDVSIIENLADSAVMVAVVTDNYVASPWCQREAQAFCEEAQKVSGLAANNLLRIFKVIKRPPETEETLPPAMRGITGTRFYMRIGKDERESSDENDMPVELDPSLGEPFAQKLRLRVNRLAQDIASTLKAVAMSEGGVTLAVAAVSARPTVYLAQCGDDRLDDHAALRSELLQRGYPVVPTGVLPAVEAECRAEVERLLAASALSVHLLGTRSGNVPGGEGADSVVAIQNELAVKRSATALLRRVVSLPAGTVESAQGVRHRQFLSDMFVSAELQGGCELIAADLEAVKAAMHAALRRIEAPPAPAAPDTGALQSVYVIFDRPDLGATKPLRLALEDYATVLKPAFDGEPAAVREANLQNLAACDAVLIYYGSGSDGWKAAVDGDLLRARALRGGRPFRAAITWLAGDTTDDKEDLLGRPGVIDARGEFTPALLEPVRQGLQEARLGQGG